MIFVGAILNKIKKQQEQKTEIDYDIPEYFTVKLIYSNPFIQSAKIFEHALGLKWGDEVKFEVEQMDNYELICEISVSSSWGRDFFVYSKLEHEPLMTKQNVNQYIKKIEQFMNNQ